MSTQGCLCPGPPRLRRGVGLLAALVLIGLLAPALSAARERRHPNMAGLIAGGEVQSDNVWAGPLGARIQHPRGWILLIHGGGWFATGAAVTQATLGAVQSLRAHGWAVDDVDYRPGRAALSDVVAAYRNLRAVHGGAPVCALGQSAGASMALLLAAAEPSLRCVIAEGALTDLADLADQPAWAPAGVSPLTGPESTYRDIIAPNFGTERTALLGWSPVSYAATLRARVLMGGSSFDWVVPERAQMTEFRRADPTGVRTMLLGGEPTPAGTLPNFVHASITAAAARAWDAAELRLLAGEAADPAAG